MEEHLLRQIRHEETEGHGDQDDDGEGDERSVAGILELSVQHQEFQVGREDSSCHDTPGFYQVREALRSYTEDGQHKPEADAGSGCQEDRPAGRGETVSYQPAGEDEGGAGDGEGCEERGSWR